MNVKNILIIGASGFIGQALTKKLLKTKNNIYLTSRDQQFKHTKVKKIYCGDLINPSFCKKILKKVDLVYYLAGYKKNLKWHLEQPFEFYDNNTLPLLNFLKALSSSRVKTVIYLSTINVSYFNPDDEDYLFKSRKGKNKPITVSNANMLVKKWTRTINLNGNYGTHSLRKTFGYILRRKYGVGWEILAKRYNHRRLQLLYLFVKPLLATQRTFVRQRHTIHCRHALNYITQPHVLSL